LSREDLRLHCDGCLQKIAECIVLNLYEGLNTLGKDPKKKLKQIQDPTAGLSGTGIRLFEINMRMWHNG
jgi:hypothetical protein